MTVMAPSPSACRSFEARPDCRPAVDRHSNNHPARAQYCFECYHEAMNPISKRPTHPFCDGEESSRLAGRGIFFLVSRARRRILNVIGQLPAFKSTN